MKDIRFNISLYVIIPVIIAGISVLATITSFNITTYYFKRGFDPTWPVAFWGTVMVIVTAVFGILIVKFIIGPMKPEKICARVAACLRLWLAKSNSCITVCSRP